MILILKEPRRDTGNSYFELVFPGLLFDDSTPNMIHNVGDRSLVEHEVALGIQTHSTPAESKWAAAQDKAKKLMELRKRIGMLPNEPNKDSFHNNHNANTGSGILVGSGKKKKKTRRKRRKRKTKPKGKGKGEQEKNANAVNA